MRPVLALSMALVFVLGLAGAALAQGTQPAGSSAPSGSSASPSATSPSSGGSGSSTTTAPSGSATDTTKSTAPSGTTGKTDPAKPAAGTAGKSDPAKDATKTDKSAAGKPADKAAGSARGQHKMMGEVTKIDSAKGMVTLKTDEGDLDLHFPPSALQGIKEGDRVEVQLAIRPASGSAAGSKAAPGKTSGATDMSKGGSHPSGSGAKAPASTGTPQPPKTQ